jgi:tight adherence protein C
MTASQILLLSTVSTVVVGLRTVAAWRRDSQSSLSRQLVLLGAWARPAEQSEVDGLKGRLASAGLRELEALDQFLAARLLSLVGVAFIGAIFGRSTGNFYFALGLGIIGALLGWVVPGEILDLWARARRKAITYALPGSIDLMVICMDAGLALEQAVGRITGELAQTDAVLADEFGVVAREMEAGVSVAESLRRLARRVRIEELESLCAVLGQASLLGARVSQTLRDYSASLRRRRMAQLDEKAGKIGATLTLPLALCLLPASLLVMLGPAILIVLRSMKG